jgi:hypothetical protein
MKTLQTPGPVTPENKQIARHVASVFGGTPRVDEYANDSDTLFVGILWSCDRPGAGVTSYSTIKLSDHPMVQDGEEFPVRIELVGVCDNSVTTFPNLLASAAFDIMHSEGVYRPGTVIPDLVRQSGVSSTLPHLYLNDPFLWEDKLHTIDVGTKRVTWLLAMPISEAEYAYLQEHGDRAFEHLLAEQQVDVFNPERPPAV